MDLTFCGDCGTRAPLGQAFCRACGSRLAEALRTVGHGAGDRLSHAVSLLVRGEAAKACDELEQLVASQPDEAIARAYLGISYLRLTRVEDAREALEQAVDLAPDSFICRAKYAEFLARLGFFDQALAQLDAALSLSPPNTESRMAALELRQHCRDKSRGLYYRPLGYPKLGFRLPRRASRPVTLQG